MTLYSRSYFIGSSRITMMFMMIELFVLSLLLDVGNTNYYVNCFSVHYNNNNINKDTNNHRIVGFWTKSNNIPLFLIDNDNTAFVVSKPSLLLASANGNDIQESSKEQRNDDKENQRTISHPEYSVYNNDNDANENEMVTNQFDQSIISSINEEEVDDDDDDEDFMHELDNFMNDIKGDVTTFNAINEEDDNVIDDDENDDENDDDLIDVSIMNHNDNDDVKQQLQLQQKLNKIQYVAYQPLLQSNHNLRIQLGNITLARKAWKKRRRSGSPLLIPCSILTIHSRLDMIKYNTIYLIQKFGNTYSHNQIRLSLSELLYRYRTHLKISLTYHTNILGSETPFDFIQDLFSNNNNEIDPSNQIKIMIDDNANTNKKVLHEEVSTTHNHHIESSQETVGVSTNGDSQPQEEQLELLLSNDDSISPMDYSNVWLHLPISRLRARQRSSQAALLQFYEDNNEEVESSSSNNLLVHTGLARNRRNNKLISHLDTTTITEKASVTSTIQEDATADVDHNNNDGNTTNNSAKNRVLYSLKPLSVALRVSHDDMSRHTLSDGSIHTAVMLHYDSTGDGGAPLITLSLKNNDKITTTSNNNNNNNMNGKKQLEYNKDDQLSSSVRNRNNNVVVEKRNNNNNKYSAMLDDLNTGQKLQGKVIKYIKGGAIIDCGIGKNDDNEIYKVYGVISFQDAYILVEQNNNNDKNTKNKKGYYDEWDSNSYDSSRRNKNSYEDNTKSKTAKKKDSNSKAKSTSIDELFSFDDGDDDGGEIEDVTHLCIQNEDGSFTYTDPDTGETQTVYADDDHDHDDEDDDDDDDDDEYIDAKDMNVNARETSPNKVEADTYQSESKSSSYNSMINSNNDNNERRKKSITINIGDTITVYVKHIKKKNIRYPLIVTMDSSIHGKKSKQLKFEKDVSKKLSRLLKHTGGTLNEIYEMKGYECDGIIQATSNRGGDWLYVQPILDNDNNEQQPKSLLSSISSSSLPVGIATISKDLQDAMADNDSKEAEHSTTDYWRKGDKVRVVIDGIDVVRGQLSMQIVKKLS